MFYKVLCVLVSFVILSSAQIFAYPKDTAKYLGDACTTSTGKKGICSKNCIHYRPRNLFLSRECEFDTFGPIICCPYSEKFEKALCNMGSTSGLTQPLDLQYNIVGGVEAEIGEFPFFTALGYRTIDNEAIFDCGGSLIASDIVLTAAHCVNNIGSREIIVRIGRVSLLNSRTFFFIKILIH